MSKLVAASLETTDMKAHQKLLDDAPVNVRVKLAAAWASFVMLYIYVDYFILYKPGFVQNILAGKMFVFDVTQGVLLGALVSVSIPALMVFLSVALPATVNRWTNLIVAGLNIPYAIVNIIGEEWVFFFAYGIVAEVALLALIIRYAWKWPRATSGSIPRSR